MTQYYSITLFAVIAIVYDLKERRIPNYLTLSILAIGLIFGIYEQHIGESLLGMLAGGGALFVFYLFGGMGAGDVKFMAAVGAVLGIDKIGMVLLLTALIGGAMAIGHIISKKAWKPVFSNISLIVKGAMTGTAVKPEHLEKHAASDGLPYGVAIGLAAITTLFL